MYDHTLNHLGLDPRKRLRPNKPPQGPRPEGDALSCSAHGKSVAKLLRLTPKMPLRSPSGAGASFDLDRQETSGGLRSHNWLVPVNELFQVEVDAEARAWLDSHPSPAPRVIVYEVKRCCGGGKICNVRVRKSSRRDDVDKYSTATLEDGTKFLVDRRAAARLPARFALTMRGLGPFRHIDLDLDSEQWGALLYD